MSVLEVQQHRANQAQKEVARGFSQASDLVNQNVEQVTHFRSLVDAANGNYSRRFEEANNKFETMTESIQFLHGRLVHVDTAFMELRNTVEKCEASH
jgi:hypothetical protein